MKYYKKNKPFKKFSNFLTYAILIITVIVTLTPIFLMVVSSLSMDIQSLGKTTVENSKAGSVSLISTHFHLKNYIAVFKMTHFLTYMRNSLFVAGFTTIFSIIIAILGGYAISRFKFKGRIFFSQGLLVMYMFPPVLLLIPIFMLLKSMGLFNTPFSLIIAYTTFSLPFCIWMLKGFFDSIPQDLEEQAMVDGCTKLGSMFRILLPLSGPGIATTAIFSFILAWNEFMYANALINTDKWKTVTVGLPSFAGQYMTEIGIMFAASTLLIIPVLIFFSFLQKFIVRGLTAGAVKG